MKGTQQVLRFGSFEADLQAGELRRNGRKLKLQEQPFQILVALLERPGEVVTREDLRQRLWPSDTFVDFDNGLNIAVRKLRRALGDDAGSPRHIETLPRRGYRFLGVAEQVTLAPLPLLRTGARDSRPQYPGLPVTSYRDDRIVPISQGFDMAARPSGTRESPSTAQARAPAPRLDAEPAGFPLEAGSSGTPEPVPGFDVSNRTAVARVALLMVASALVVGAVVYLRRGSQSFRKYVRPASAGMSREGAISDPKPRPSVAALGIKNLSPNGRDTWLSPALSEMLATELGGGERLLIVSGENVARARIDLALADADSYSPETLARLRRRLGADYVVLGSCFSSGQGSDTRLRLDLRLQDTRSGRTVATLTEAGMEGDLPGLVTRAGAGLRQKLGLDPVTAEQANGVRASLPSNNDATRLYAEGLAKLRAFDAQGARDLLEQAVATDPGFAPAHAALAQAWSRLGYDQLAAQETKKAYELAAKLPRADRMFIEAAYRESNAEWDKAIEIYRTLSSFFPDNIEYGLRLANAQVRSGKGKDALATVALSRKASATAQDDPALDLVESQAADQLGDIKRAQAAAAAAAEHAESRGARILKADALARQCREMPLLGRFADAHSACGNARELYARAGDRDGVALATGYLAAVLGNEGQPAAARQMYEEALAVDETIGNKGGAIWEINGLANVAWAQGDLSAARERYQQAMTVARETGSRPDVADALNNAGYIDLLEGNLAQAREALEQALAAYRSISNGAGIGGALDNLGATLYFQGDLTGAASTLEDAVTTDRENGDKPESADALAWWGRVRMAQGALDDAGDRYREAVAVWQEIGDKSYQAQYSLRLAELSVESGKPTAAEQTIRESIGFFKSEHRPDREIEARSLLAEAFLEEGKKDEAREQVDEAARLINHSQNRAARLDFAIAAARVHAASGGKSDVASAVKGLETALDVAEHEGFLGYEFEIRLALGEIELKGQRSVGLARLAMLEQDARAKGFGLIARKAAAARAAEAGPTPSASKSA